ncbi:hypothetical protein ACRAWG_15605 [Methylobacterium sp. P31]
MSDTTRRNVLEAGAGLAGFGLLRTAAAAEREAEAGCGDLKMQPRDGLDAARGPAPEGKSG